MVRKKTNFEQVPLEVVKRVMKEQVRQKEAGETGLRIKKNELDRFQQLLLGASTPHGYGRRA
jgi:hypothetical protein